jgi:Protein of unknown function (DUF1570)
MHRPLIAIVLCCLAPAAAAALDRVVLKRDGRETRVAGQLLVTAVDGGLLLLAPDSALWTVSPDELVAHTTDDEPFRPLAGDALAERLLKELPAGFEVYTTQHYLICHNTSRAYAQWCGGRFEQLYRGFTNYWSRQGFELEKPRFPLVALVFADRESYVKHATAEVGSAAESIIGYYNLATNRMTMYDLTGLQSLRRPGDKRGSPAQISQMLARPESERTLATVIHEATHQIAYNCGLQTRLADIPLWVSEGIAVYFEMSDLGAINPPRLAAFREYAPRRPADSLRTLVADDKRFRDTRKAPEAYAEAWALNYFLIRQRPKQYRAYMKTLSAKKPLLWDEPATRLQEFQLAFGDLNKLDADFLRYLGRVK